MVSLKSFRLPYWQSDSDPRSLTWRACVAWSRGSRGDLLHWQFFLSLRCSRSGVPNRPSGSQSHWHVICKGLSLPTPEPLLCDTILDNGKGQANVQKREPFLKTESHSIFNVWRETRRARKFWESSWGKWEKCHSPEWKWEFLKKRNLESRDSPRGKSELEPGKWWQRQFGVSGETKQKARDHSQAPWIDLIHSNKASDPETEGLLSIFPLLLGLSFVGLYTHKGLIRNSY